MFKKLTLSNRFWGVLMIAAGSAMQFVPVLNIAGMTLLAAGIAQTSVGMVNKAKRTEEDKTASPDKVESKIN